MNHAELRAVLEDADVNLGDCISAFATDENHPAIVLARARLHKPCELEIGEPTYVSETPSGCYVLAWAWVPKPEEADGDSLTMPLNLGEPR